MMTLVNALSALAFVFVLTLPAAAQPVATRDGAVVARTPCPPYSAVTYAQYVETARERHAEEVTAAKREGIVMRTPLSLASPEEFERGITASKAVECTRIGYLSDGLKVAGFIWRPKDQGTKRLPLIIFNRGGNREFGKLAPWHSFHRLAAEGFVVIASQYRGADGGEGQEEFGGADVHDVMNLVPLAESLGYVDTNNVFVLGWSRGAMMTFLALKQGIRVNAAAVGGGLLDLVSEARRRPAIATNVWSELMPGYDTRAGELLRERSAMYWPERITVPVLIMHGGADWRASPAEALTFAQKLHEAGKTYELIVYAGDDHAISGNKADSNRRIVDWFRKHMK